MENIPWKKWTCYICAPSKLCSFLMDYANLTPNTINTLCSCSPRPKMYLAVCLYSTVCCFIKPAYFESPNLLHTLCKSALTILFGLSVQYADICNLLCVPFSSYSKAKIINSPDNLITLLWWCHIMLASHLNLIYIFYTAIWLTNTALHTLEMENKCTEISVQEYLLFWTFNST